MKRKTGRIMMAVSLLILGLQTGAAETNRIYNAESVEAGRRLYQIHCPACHGQDARARIDFVSDATDLTTPARYRNGSTPADLFRSISEGAGTDMPPFQYTLTRVDDRWHLIHFIISTWTPEERAVFLGDSNE
ncbi:MAG: cytochrome c [Pseudomonadales bacterium]|nr:cytochrome c [Pseudomonadales bacterium]